MARHNWMILFLAVLFVGGGLFSAQAVDLDLDGFLREHDPREDENTSSTPAYQAAPPSTTPEGATASPPPQGVIDLIDEITKVMEEIAKILEEKAAKADDQDKEEKASDRGGSTYTVQSGDTLWGIAQRFLGAGNRYWDIVEANKDKYPSIAKNPNLIYPGWKLTIPGGNGGGQASNGGSRPTPAPGPGTPAPNVPAPAPGAKGGKALLGWLQQAGLSGDKLRTAWAVGMAESGGNPRAHNGNAGTGDNSYGLFQINMIGSLGPARLKQYGLKSNEELFDPAVNIRVMIRMSGNCTNWSPWSAYKNGAYRKFYNQFPPK